MLTNKKVSNGVPVSEGPGDDICCIGAWLREPYWQVRNEYYTHRVDSFSEFNNHFNRQNINEFIDTLTATGKYLQINVTFHSSN